eukprot:TRINITY_DN22568_c0_g1_i2.p1 TRINITY_DN22568_c0_g1~~TRINITY_DN22568_c0_g1_i2.p1  ORF type:complete len:496 (-),score=121.74 TRINITY_DN22568_c0_g1_i2:42-1529(-)
MLRSDRMLKRAPCFPACRPPMLHSQSSFVQKQLLHRPVAATLWPSLQLLLLSLSLLPVAGRDAQTPSGHCSRAAAGVGDACPADVANVGSDEEAASPVRWRTRAYERAETSAEVYGGAHAATIFKKHGYEAEIGDDWDLLWTHRPQLRALSLAGISAKGSGGLRLVNQCGYFKAAGQKCHFAGHVNRVVAELEASGDPARTARFAHLRNFVLNHEEPRRRWREEVQSDPSKPWVLKECSAGLAKGVEILHGQALLERAREGRPRIWTVAQEYLVNPFLGFGGRKFHLRVYVLVTGWAPSPHVFMFDEGIVFRSRHSYDDKSVSTRRDVFSAVSPDVEALPHAALWTAIDAVAARSDAIGSAEVRGRLQSVVRELFGGANVALEQSMGSAAAHAERLESQGLACFDFFGLDVMLSASLEPYVLEVNFGSNLEVDDRGSDVSAFLRSVKGPLLEQLAQWSKRRLRRLRRGGAAVAEGEAEAEDHAEADILQNFTRVL